MESKAKDKSQAEINDGRKNVMLIGITVIMAVVVLLWLFNIKSFINPYSEKILTASSSESNLSWKDVKGRFDQTMSQVVDKMNEFEVQKKIVADPANASSSLSNLEDVLNAKINESHASTSLISSSSPSQAEEVSARLEEMEKSLNKK
jgi:hypothetical protein